MTGDFTTGNNPSPPPGIEVARIDFSDPRDPALEGWKVVPKGNPENEGPPTGASSSEGTSSSERASSTKSLPGLPETESVYFPDEVYGSVEAAYTAAVLWSRRYREEPDVADTTNISRVDTAPEQGDTHGDLVRVQRQGTLRKRFFSDANFGGKRGARHAALIWRDLVKGQMPEPLSFEAARKKSAATQSQFDVPGMTVIERTDAEGFVHPALQVRWTTPSGDTRRHIRSLKKWSPRQGVWKAAKRVVEEYEGGNVDVRRSYLFSALPESWFEEATTTERVQHLFERAVSGATAEAERILRARNQMMEGLPGLSLATRKRNGRYVPLLRVTYEDRAGREKERSRMLGCRSLASATHDLCRMLVEEWEEAPPEGSLPSSQAGTSPFSVFRTGLAADEQVENLVQLALPSLQQKMRELLSGPPGVSLYFQRLASGRYSPMVEATWPAPAEGLRRGVSSVLEHTLRGALLRTCEKAARALASGEVRQASLFGKDTPFSNLTPTSWRALGFPQEGPGDEEGPALSALLQSEDKLFELVAHLYRAVLPPIEAAYHLRVLHGAPGLRIAATSPAAPKASSAKEASAQVASGQEASRARLLGRWPQPEDSSWTRSEASISERGLGGALKEVLEELAREVGEGRVDIETALLEESPLRALALSKERLDTLAGEDLQETLFDKLYPPLCALQRIEDGPKKRREDQFIGTHLSIESGADAQNALR